MRPLRPGPDDVAHYQTSLRCIENTWRTLLSQGTIRFVFYYDEAEADLLRQVSSRPPQVGSGIEGTWLSYGRTRLLGWHVMFHAVEAKLPEAADFLKQRWRTFAAAGDVGFRQTLP